MIFHTWWYMTTQCAICVYGRKRRQYTICMSVSYFNSGTGIIYILYNIVISFELNASTWRYSILIGSFRLFHVALYPFCLTRKRWKLFIYSQLLYSMINWVCEIQYIVVCFNSSLGVRRTKLMLGYATYLLSDPVEFRVSILYE